MRGYSVIVRYLFIFFKLNSLADTGGGGGGETAPPITSEKL